MSFTQRLRRQLTQFSTTWALALYVALALVITWPLALYYDRAVIGDLESDVWKHLWGFWWMRQCLVVDHVLPLYTSLLNYPYGGSLFFIDPLGGMLSIPLQAVMSPVAAYNTMVLFNIWLACSGAFFLARYFTRSLPASFVAGVIYGCSPYLMSNITSGISESFNIGWIPLFFLFYSRALRESGTGNALLAGVFLGLATIGCWYYGVFCVVYAVFFFVAEWVRHLRRRLAEEQPGASEVRPGWGLPPLLRPWVGVALAFSVLEALRDAVNAQMYGARAGWPSGLMAVGLLTLLMALLRHSRRPEAEPPGRLLLVLRFVSQVAVVFSLWAFVVVLRLAPQHADSGNPRLVFLGALSVGAFWLSVAMWQRFADDVLAVRLGVLKRMTERAILLGLCALLTAGTWRQLLHPAADPDERAVRAAWLGIGWLAALWIAFRSRERLRALWRDVQAARPRRTASERAMRLLACAAVSSVAVYLLVPPHSASLTAGAWAAAIAGLSLLLQGLDMGVATWQVGGREVDRVVRGTQLDRVLDALREFYETVFKRALIVALVSGTLILPVAYVFKHTLNSDVSLVFRVRNLDNVDFHLSEQFHNISRLVDYVVPGKAAAVRTYTVDRLTRVSYAGWLVLLLVAAAWRVRRRDVRWWFAVAIGAVTFSLGPFLYVTSDIHLSGRFPPYMWMYDWFPFFSQVSIPFRFDVVATLAFGVLTAYTLAARMRSQRLETQTLLAISVSLAVLLEVMYVSPAPFPMPLASTEAPPLLAKLAAESGPCGLLDVPVQRFEGELLPGEYFYYQMIHGKSIPNRVEGEIPIYVFRNRFMLQLFHLEHDWPGYPNDNEKALMESLTEMRDFKFRYIVVHENLLRAGAGGRIHAMLRWFLGEPRHHDGDITVYDVGEGKTR